MRHLCAVLQTTRVPLAMASDPFGQCQCFVMLTDRHLKHRYSSCDQVQSPNLVTAGTVTAFSLESSCHVKACSICIYLYKAIQLEFA